MIPLVVKPSGSGNCCAPGEVPFVRKFVRVESQEKPEGSSREIGGKKSLDARVSRDSVQNGSANINGAISHDSAFQ